ncbi:MAG: hypothetical protein EA376_13840 [Phycisphaeraceae bacterium]|nr:MAG: hypothetical protein EA376_13840 [Phycisphaeraceae bacterium]
MLVVCITLLAALISKAYWGYILQPPTLSQMLDKHAPSVHFERRHVLSADQDNSARVTFRTTPDSGTTVNRLKAAVHYSISSPFGEAVKKLESHVPDAMSSRDAELESWLQSIMSEELERIYQRHPPRIVSGSPLWGMAAAGRDAESGSTIVASTMLSAPIDATRSPCWIMVFKVDEKGGVHVLEKQMFYHGGYADSSMTRFAMLMPSMFAAAAVVIFFVLLSFGVVRLFVHSSTTRRRLHGRCEACGYDVQDLTGTHPKCPECGRRIPRM